MRTTAKPENRELRIILFSVSQFQEGIKRYASVAVRSGILNPGGGGCEQEW